MKTLVKILGINASHRKGWNTAYALDRALKGARMLGPWVETETIHLKDYHIKECVSCHWCFMEASDEKFCSQCSQKDDFKEIYPKLLEADGFVVACPVYWGTMTGKLKDFIDRTNPFCHGANTKFGGGLAGKTGGVISVAYDIHGGAELTINHIHAWMLGQDMIVVGNGCHHPHGAYIGGIATSQSASGEASRETVKSDRFGMRSIYGLGKRVSEVSLITKLGQKAAEKILKDHAFEPADSSEKQKRVHLDWDSYYSEQIHFPREHVAVPGRPGTSEEGFEKFLEVMSARSAEDKRKGLTYGRGIVDPEATKRIWMKERGLLLMGDTDLYWQCPEFYERYRKSDRKPNFAKGIEDPESDE